MGGGTPVQTFDIEVFRSSAWFVVQAGLDRRLLGRALDTHLGMSPRALRVIRRLQRADNLYQGASISHFWRPAEVQNLHEDLPGFQNQTDLEWRSRQDLEQPLARHLLRHHFGVFLRSRACTVFDLLYDPRIADELLQSWQIVQAALQPIAGFQANILGGDVPGRVRDLGRFFDEMLKQIILAGKNSQATPIEKGGLGLAIQEIHARYPEAERHGQIMLRLCLSMPSVRNWPERLIGLMALVSHAPTPLEYYYLDRYLAELVQIDGVVLDTGRANIDIAQQITQLRDWVNGQKLDHAPSMMGGWQVYNDFMRTGGLPWTRDALRQILLKILRTIPEQSPPDLVQAIVDIDLLGTDIDLGFACWRGDPEIQDCLEQRISWLVNRDNVQRLMIRHRQPSERLSAIASMFSILRRLPNRDRFAGFLEEFLVVPVLVKELAGEFSGTLPAVPPLLRFAQRLERLDIDPDCRGRMFEALDRALWDIFQKEIVAPSGRSDIERVLSLLKLWLPTPLQAGQCRDLAEELLAKAVEKPEFSMPFWIPTSTKKCASAPQRGWMSLWLPMALRRRSLPEGS